MTEPNPYAAPTSPAKVNSDVGSIVLDPKDRKKAEAIVKDAGQFWLAIILCIFCSINGALLIPIWYTVRFLQWNSMAKKYPALVAAGAPAGSFPAKFKSSQWKLIVGIVIGVVILGLLAFNIFTMVSAIQQGQLNQ